MLKKTLALTALIASASFLTACGSSGSGASAVISSPISDRIASLSEVGNYSFGSTSSASDNTFDYTYRETADTFNLRVSGNRLVMRINGVEYSVTLDNDSTNNYSGEGNVYLFVSGGDAPQVIDGTHARIQGTYVSYGTDTNDYGSEVDTFSLDLTFGYATVGSQTPPSAVASQTATATYEGRMSFNVNPSNVTSLDAPSDEFYYGDASMDVNFDAMTIGGTAALSKDSDDNPDQSVDVGRITFAPSPIVGNGFAGTFTLNSDLRRDAALTGNPVGNYAGNFFGPEADDIAGVMQLNGTNANGAVLGIGGFRGDRQ